MPFASALSSAANVNQAVSEVCDRAGAGLGGRADLAVVFFSTHHLGSAQVLAESITRRLSPGVLLGCVAETVIGDGREVEQGPALSLWLARFARSVRLRPFHLVLEQTADGPSLFGWPDELLGAGGDEPREPFAPARSAVLLLGDPYTFPTDLFLTRMNEDARGVPVLGGMASGISQAGDCRLIRNDSALDQGAVGVLMEGDLALRWIVSQGCRPIGRHMVVTKSQQNEIQELSGKTPLDQLRELWPTLPERDQRLFQRGGLHLGFVLNEYQDEFQRGDFLIRNVVGVEPNSGALVVNEHVRVGQTVQFQLRDAEAADEDLHALLQLDLHAHERRPAGALLFSCNGRGTRLFDQPDHDVSVIRQEAGPIPLAGLFAMGELGPVGGQNFIHGFTASVALFEDE
jgi:small ligand-binding sensory domain FIST